MRYDIRPTEQGHDQHQVSELVHQERGMGSGGRSPRLGAWYASATTSPPTRAKSNGPASGPPTSSWRLRSASSTAPRSVRPRTRWRWRAFRRPMTATAALGDCAPPKSCAANGSLKPGGVLSGLKQIAPRNNPLGLIPKVILGTLQNNSQAVPDIAYDGRWPIDGADTSMPIYLNFTYTQEHAHLQGRRHPRVRAVRPGALQHLRRTVRLLERLATIR